MLLAIDTSTQLAGLALYDGSVRVELVWVAGRQHSTQLLPQVDRLLDLIGTDQAAITAVAAARGPGSFTGLRVGLATAQGLALARGLPCFGVETLDVLAAGQGLSDLAVRPLLDAGRGRFATALYRRTVEGWVRQTEMLGIELRYLPSLVDEPCLLCGDLDSEAREQIRAMLGERVRLASPALALRRPAILAELAWRRWQSGQAGGLTELEPLYLTR